jgi:flagellar motor switch protein FliN/FliY
MDNTQPPDQTTNTGNTLQPEETAELMEETSPPVTPAPVQGNGNTDRNLEFLFDVPLQVSIEVGRARILLKDLLHMGEGYVIELDKLSGDPLDLYVNSRLIARGEAVKVGDKFGIKLTEVVSQSDRIAKLG